MAGATRGLTAGWVQKVKEAGVYADGGGLYLQVQVGRDGSPKRSWLVRYTAPGGRRREMGLGSAALVSLADARGKALDMRRLAANGVDPLAERERKEREAIEAARAEAARAVTFAFCAEAYIEAHKGGWKHAKTAYSWPACLKRYAYPVFGDLPVGRIDQTLVIEALTPIWSSKTETACTVRQRIEAVLDWASVNGYRSGENPARWRGHLQKVFPAKERVQPTRHQPALPYDQAPTFMERLKALPGLTPLAARLLILTACRTSEVLQARWAEIDRADAVWKVPAERTKMGREHRVPLPAAALAVLDEAEATARAEGLANPQGWLFPSSIRRCQEKPLSNMAILMMLRRMGCREITAHGFRSTFRDWSAECTDFANEVCEAALAHAIGSKVEAAYRRGDLFTKRRALMQAWADYLLSAS